MDARIALLAVAALALVGIRRWLSRGTLPGPPGPPGHPIIGHALLIPKIAPWASFAEWGRTYGDVVQFRVFGQPSLVLNSYAAASELLDRLGTTYSDRPPMVVVGALGGWDRVLGQLPYGARHRAYRRVFHTYLGPRPVQALAPIVRRAIVVRLLGRLLVSPEKFLDHTRHMVGASVLAVSHGYDVKPENDPIIAVADHAMTDFAKHLEPGRWLVDIFPIFDRLPTWFPGTHAFRRAGREIRATLDRLFDEPYDFVKQQIDAGKPNTSIIGQLITEGVQDEQTIKSVGGSIYAGGADTSTSVLSAFFMVMCQYPAIAARAQAELDSVVGLSRLPELTDRPRLPYINAIVLETARYSTIGPLGLAHRLMKDDVYKGYELKAGTTIYANLWAMTHDPQTYPDPFRFDPDRFIPGAKGEKDSVQHDPYTIIFGFGRRICPGIHLADQTLFLTMASVLATFDLAVVPGPDGGPPDLGFDDTKLLIHPRPFQCRITPRSPAHAEVVRNTISELENMSP